MGKGAAAGIGLLCAVAMAFPPASAVGETTASSPGAAVARAETAPDFTLRSLDGEEVTLSRFLGRKPVMLVFWATWCPICKESIPKINALHEGPVGRNLQILGLDFRESHEKVAAAVRAEGIRYPVLLDDRGATARAFGVVGIPTYVVIDREGRIVYRENVLPPDPSRYL